MDGDRPYTWARKVGIEKGLFQYYWQKGKIPTYANLLKIKKHTGCSLDWLLTGQAIAVDKIDSLPSVNEKGEVYGKANIRTSKALESVKQIYSSRNEGDIKLLEGFLDKLIPATKSR